MGWVKVYIRYTRSADKAAARLVAHLSRLFHLYGASKDAIVYHVRIPMVGHVYYLPPETVHIAGSALDQYGEVTPADPPSSLKELERVEF